MVRKLIRYSLAGALAAVPAAAQSAVDAGAAEALMKKSGCLKCHSVSAKKEGPPFKETAAKYKGKADAEKTVTDQVTKAPKVKFPDGSEDTHDVVETKDPAAIKNLVEYILAQ